MDGGVCRTTLATPGLLKKVKFKYAIPKKHSVNNGF